ncbi:MAG TPA: hypothetical protein P5117_14355, partial [Spirochaetia bacterium]|nr:hypothetical protein [Spirochaetia bacterium]
MEDGGFLGQFRQLVGPGILVMGMVQHRHHFLLGDDAERDLDGGGDPLELALLHPPAFNATGVHKTPYDLDS